MSLVYFAGKRRIFDVLVSPTANGSAGIGIDTTEADKMRSEIAGMNEAHRRLLDQLATGVAIFGVNQKLAFYNAAYRSLWDLDAGFLEQNPSDGAVLDKLRAARKLPEEQDFRQWKNALHEAYRATAALLKPGPLVISVLLSTLSWYFECVAFLVVVHGFPGAAIGNQAGTFIYASMTVAGALSFLPGGLGVTEAGMLALLGDLGTGTGRSVAAAATFVTRLCTLWYAVLVGLVALFAFARRTHIQVQLPEKTGDRLSDAT